MKEIEVVAAIIKNGNKFLCVQRGENKYSYISRKYEFPGGKLELGETKTECIQREIFEELEMKIEVQSEFLTVVHQYPDFKLKMHSFICTCDDLTPKLNEHINYIWLEKEQLNSLDWADADIPIMKKLTT
jgi:8-oxo-dGTP diphosphatase